MNTYTSHLRSQVDRILVVDDVADNSFLLQTLLESEGYVVEVVESGHEALAKIAAEPPSLVLLDVMMPDMNGFEVTRQIRQSAHLPFIPIVLVSGYDSIDISQLTVEANGFIRKPIQFEEVLEQVRSQLLTRN